MNNDEVTMLILSCDAFSDLWDGHARLLDENWPDRNIPTYIVTDAPNDWKHEGVTVLSIGADAEWSDRLFGAINSVVDTEFVFVTLDDYFLVKQVDDSQICNLVKTMKEESLDYVRLFPRPKKATREELPGHAGLRWVDTSCMYSVNLYSGVWKRDFLASTVRNPENAWQYEVALHKRAQEYGARCAVSERKEFVILDVVRKGKLLHSAAAYFRKHPGLYEGKRDVNTWGYEIRLTIQQLASRHLPQPFHSLAKSIARKCGMRFFSDSV